MSDDYPIELYEDCTEKQELFCRGYVFHLNATRAYREAYDVHEGATYCGTEAWKLLQKPEIRERINTLRGAYTECVQVNLQWVVDGLRGMAEEARADGDRDTFVKCMALLAKHTGALVERVEHTHNSDVGEALRLAHEKRRAFRVIDGDKAS